MRTITTLIGLLLTAAQVFATNPEASNLNITGVNHVGSTLTIEYTFSDADGDLESGTTFQWYSADDAIGTGLSSISGATSSTYELTSSEANKYITCAVTPIDDNAEVGLEYFSGYSDEVMNYSSLTYSSNKTHDVSGREDYYTLTANNTFTLNIGAGDSLIIWSTFLVQNQTLIVVNDGGYFEIKGNLEAQNNPNISIQGTVKVLNDIIVSNNATFEVAEGGQLDVEGSLITENVDILNIEGTVNIAQDLNIGNNSTLNIDMDDNGNGELNVGGSFIAGTNTVVNGYGPVTVGGTVSGNVEDPTFPQVNMSTLPIELVYFKANFQDGVVNLRWSTASELNNDYFTIEQSTDGVNFVEIEDIPGAGNSSSQLDYETEDFNPAEGISYYKLKQTDYNGDFSYSKVESVNNSLVYSDVETKAVIYPNPVQANTSTLNIEISGDFNDETAQVNIFTTSGQQVHGSEVYLDGFASNQSIDISSLTKGNYFIIVKTANNSIPNKLIIL